MGVAAIIRRRALGPHFPISGFGFPMFVVPLTRGAVMDVPGIAPRSVLDYSHFHDIANVPVLVV